MQQSVRSVENAIDVSDAACEQHGIRVQKPMIAVAGARPARSRTIASAIGFRFIFDVETSSIRSIQTGEAVKRFLAAEPHGKGASFARR